MTFKTLRHVTLAIALCGCDSNQPGDSKHPTSSYHVFSGILAKKVGIFIVVENGDKKKLATIAKSKYCGRKCENMLLAITREYDIGDFDVCGYRISMRGALKEQEGFDLFVIDDIYEVDGDVNSIPTIFRRDGIVLRSCSF